MRNICSSLHDTFWKRKIVKINLKTVRSSHQYSFNPYVTKFYFCYCSFFWGRFVWTCCWTFHDNCVWSFNEYRVNYWVNIILKLSYVFQQFHSTKKISFQAILSFVGMWKIFICKNKKKTHDLIYLKVWCILCWIFDWECDYSSECKYLRIMCVPLNNSPHIHTKWQIFETIKVKKAIYFIIDVKFESENCS